MCAWLLVYPLPAVYLLGEIPVMVLVYSTLLTCGLAIHVSVVRADDASNELELSFPPAGQRTSERDFYLCSASNCIPCTVVCSSHSTAA
jgi:hypothetical protein